MRILSALLLSTALAWPCLAAEPQERPGPTAGQAVACLEGAQPGVCLMRLAVPYEAADAMAYDPVFISHPELAAALGLSAEGFDPSRAPPEDRSGFREGNRAMWLVWQRARAGEEPDKTLAPILALPSDGPVDVHRVRTQKLERLFWAAHNAPGLPGKADLETAILKQWEKDSRAEDDFTGFFSEDLTSAYIAAGDTASAERLYREGWRIPPQSPALQEASVLRASHQWDRAMAVLKETPADPEAAWQVLQERILLANSMARAGHAQAPDYIVEVLVTAPYSDEDPLPFLRLFEYLLREGTVDQIRPVAQRWNEALPAVSEEQSFLSILLLKAYSRLGDTSRADAMLAAWRPPIGQPIDASFREEVYGRMLLSQGNRAAVLARGWPLERVVQAELVDQQAIADLEGWLATMSPEDRKLVLQTCRDAGLSLGPIPQVKACERRAAAEPGQSDNELADGLIDALAEPDGQPAAAIERMSRRWREHPERQLDPDMVQIIGAYLYARSPTSPPVKP